MKHKTTLAAYKLLQRGAEALSKIEAAGVRVDKGYLDEATEGITAKIKDLQNRMQSDKEVFPQWRKAYGQRMNLGSREQIGKVIFDRMKFKSAGDTASGRHRTDKTALETVDLPFVRDFLKVEELKKAKSTYLDGIRREVVETPEGWFVHPSYNLNTVTTFRSSCSNPNFQNIPVRNAEIGEMIRRCYIPRKGNHFVEVDYSQIEVRVAACYNHDPTLIKYIKDTSTDMHRDMACQLYMLKPDQVIKETRHAAKNLFVFRSFYGGVYYQSAPELWDAITQRNLTVGKDGPSLLNHLKSKGVTGLDVVMVKNKQTGKMKLDHDPRPGSFGHHVKKIEQDFWERRFKVYNQWKKDWYDAYRRDGGYTTLTGFAVNGLLSRNDVINYGIQGSAFHCCLLSVVKLAERLEKYKMRSLLVGEIHDSIQSDIHPSELQDVLDMHREVMVEEVPSAWDWLIVPLDVEAEVSPVGESWHKKKVWTHDGEWKLKV